MSKRFVCAFLAILTVAVMMDPAVPVYSQADSMEWSRGPDIPLARGGYFAAWREGGLWIAGGSYWKDGKKLWTRETSLYDPVGKTWLTLKPIPRAIGYGVTAQVGKDIFLLGGTDASGALNKDIYRLHDGTWSNVGKSPEGFIYAAYVTIGTRIYIFGGATNPSDVTKATNDSRVYDVKTERWSKLAPVPGPPRQTFSAVAIGKVIYMFGGVTQRPGEKFHNLDDAYRYDTVTGKWSSLKTLPQPMRAFWAGSDGRQIYLIGGYSEHGLDTVYRYTPSTNTYFLYSNLPQPLMDTKFIFHGGKFYGASGEDKLMSRFKGLVIGSLKK